MAYRYLSDGRELARPSAEHGICVEGPLSAEDLKIIIADLLEALCEQVKRENE